MMHKKILLFCMAMLLVGTTLRVDAAPNCSIAVKGFNFGGYDPFAGTDIQVAFTSFFTGSCSGHPIPPSIGLNGGIHSSGLPNRYLSGTTYHNLLQYNFYIDPGMTIVWGDGTNGTATAGTGLVSPYNGAFQVTLYGKLFHGQNVRPDSYGDNVTVTINF